jgi:hypothetical protein
MHFITQAVLAEDLKKGTSRSLLYHLPEKFFFIYFKYFLFYELNMTRQILYRIVTILSQPHPQEEICALVDFRRTSIRLQHAGKPLPHHRL